MNLVEEGVSAISLVLGDQLFRDLSHLPMGPILMVEDRGLATHARYHKHKLILTFSAMRHFAARLGPRVHYVPLGEGRDIWTTLADELRETEATELHAFEPADGFFRRALADYARDINVHLVLHRNPMFLTSREEWDDYARHHKRRRMADFYIWQRRRLNILIEATKEPVGGRWSFDDENRRKLPRHLRPPHVGICPPDAITSEVMDLVRTEFADHAGHVDNFGYPVDHTSARAWLDDFIENRLNDFGTYEDAISKHERIIFHSVLSPLINIGLLTPMEVIQAALSRHPANPVPLNSLEGFIRQIIGWREFMRGIDLEYQNRPVPSGPFRHRRRLSSHWCKATTGLPPLDTAIRRAFEHGYCHHIERLMVLGSAMLMCEVDPLEANRWFMEMFVDATDWVMRPNVIGMSQFADGGYFATKPYISGSSYILKMSDYGKGPWCQVWDGLYWRLIEKNRSIFEQNPRLSVMTKGLDRIPLRRRETIFIAAENFIEATTRPPL